MNRRVEYSNRALRDFRRLDNSTKVRIINRLDRLAAGGVSDVRRLQASDNDRRLRVGDWRVIFEYKDANRTIYVHRIRHRREAYR